MAGGMWVIRYRSDGALVWKRSLGAEPELLAITSGQGQVLAGLMLLSAADLGGGRPLPVGSSGRTMALARYDVLDGSHLWSESYPSSGSTVVATVAVTGASGPCAAGYFAGELKLSSEVVRTSHGIFDGFIACFTSEGDYTWDRVIQGDASWSLAALAADSTGDLFMAGSYSGTVNLGGGLVTASGSSEAFVARYTASGAHRWDEGFTTSGWSEATALTVGPGDSTVVVGRFAGTVDLAGRTRTSNGSSDVFVIRLQR